MRSSRLGTNAKVELFCNRLTLINSLAPPFRKPPGASARHVMRNLVVGHPPVAHHLQLQPFVLRAVPRSSGLVDHVGEVTKTGLGGVVAAVAFIPPMWKMVERANRFLGGSSSLAVLWLIHTQRPLPSRSMNPSYTRRCLSLFVAKSLAGLACARLKRYLRL